MDYLTEYYTHYDEEGRLATPQGKVEFLTTMTYLHRYLRPGMRVLEIGAGTGRYSLALAAEGYQVDAVELVEHNLAILHQHMRPEMHLTAIQGNALDLSRFPDDSYDLTLLLGPMYHLYTPEDQLRALSEGVRVTKPGGVLCVSYCMSDPSVLIHGFVKGNIHTLLEKQMLDPVTFTAFSRPRDLFQLYRVEDIEALRRGFPVTALHLVATDGYARHMIPTMEAMDDATFALFLRYHLATCERRDLMGLSHHTLDILRKESST